MSLGERGGRTRSLRDGTELIETHKPDLAAAVRTDILDHLATHPKWHANDLRIDVTGSSNVVGATINGLRQSGLIEKTGEWRAATAVASHGRESRVWRLTEKGRNKVSGGSRPRTSGHGPRGPEKAADPALKASSPAKVGTDTPVELTGGREEQGGREHKSTRASHSGSTPLALFDLERTIYEKREAA